MITVTDIAEAVGVEAVIAQEVTTISATLSTTTKDSDRAVTILNSNQHNSCKLCANEV